ncbi:maturase [Robinsoniella peoriensis]|uniref:maturase n=1 Tax=Robinsoniella peoriensis TaxID=180332 RepID=UPI00362CA650
MELIDVITSKENLNKAYKKVVGNKGAGGVDGLKVEELGAYIKENKDEIVQSIKNRTYMPKPVRRVYIPKDNGKMRQLGIPTVTSYCTPPNDVLECCLHLYGRQPVSR